MGTISAILILSIKTPLFMTDFVPLISFQEKIKIEPRDKTLHERMCFIADEVVRYNFSDVAVHDARILRRMKQGEVRLWVISELGSQFLPMYCKLTERRQQEDKEYVFSAVELTVARLLRDEPFDRARQKQFLDTAQFYFVVKGADVYGGIIDPVDFGDIVDLVCHQSDHILS